jgi:hypothetical protein
VSTSAAIVLFARAPEAEARAKGLPGAARCFAAVAARLARFARALGATLLHARRDGAPEAALPGARSIPQRGDGFGERLVAAAEDARALGFDRVVLVGVDTPGLGLGDLRAALLALDAGAVALGPARDGGVYLIGLVTGGPRAVDLRAALLGVRWRTRAVLGDLRRRAPGAALLRPLGDLDRAADVRALLDRADAPGALLDLLRAAQFAPAPPGPRRILAALAARVRARPARGPPAALAA